MDKPSFQFYPGDWLHDTALRACSIGARGLWIDMICLMHQCNPYGYLKVNHKVILPDNLARITGLTLEVAQNYISELEEAGVFSRDKNGVIFSRRMVRDEILRQKRAEGGKCGGNPALIKNKVNYKDNLIDNLKVNQKVNNKVKQKPTPSSSSSSSSLNNIKNNKKEIAQKILNEINRLGKEKGIIKKTLKQTTHIISRLNDGYSEEDLLCAVINVFNNGWHIQSGKAIDLEYVFRKSKIDAHINLDKPKPFKQSNPGKQPAPKESSKTPLQQRLAFQLSHEKEIDEYKQGLIEAGKYSDMTIKHMVDNWIDEKLQPAT